MVRLFFLVMALTGVTGLCAQNVSRKHTGDKHRHYYDSLMQMNYNRLFPIYGDRVYKKGFDIPFPFGIMVNNFYGRQDVDISNVKVGLRTADSTIGPVDMSKVLQFGNVTAKAYNVNARIDAWILPFLNVYTLLAWIPAASTYVQLTKPVDITSDPQQHGWAWGCGIMGAGGIGPVWVQADYDVTWADMQLLKNKVVTQVVGIRAGHTFTSNASAERNISVWCGMMGLFLNNQTVGEIPIADVFPGITQEKIDAIKASYHNWYNGLNPVGQQVADKIVGKLQDKVNGLPADNTNITYQLDKRLSSKWAGILGAQYQFSKKWQLRAESNLIGSRFSMLLSLNYRFLGFKKRTKN